MVLSMLGWLHASAELECVNEEEHSPRFTSPLSRTFRECRGRCLSQGQRTARAEEYVIASNHHDPDAPALQQLH